eukprot:CAMPEP_0202969528 /NCGR_PEP_ID=MMETSP1396-20130829/15299_1 /ASSEMBLY_ACC=CAM_ASM_000872 /TAXON_ID= /ORGANISM="Pseudokeronopsis sp., Strain Brazil" /LENGTH=126 /DNA_ID=CAMNT_0049697183 /DNA_START=1085 /DNA_END=1465 /DNA_ORIENTATION=-
MSILHCKALLRQLSILIVDLEVEVLLADGLLLHLEGVGGEEPLSGSLLLNFGADFITTGGEEHTRHFHLPHLHRLGQLQCLAVVVETPQPFDSLDEVLEGKASEGEVDAGALGQVPSQVAQPIYLG